MEPIKYTTSLLTFYLKGEIRQSDNLLNVKKPNTILKFIPLGSKKDSIAINQITSVTTNFKVNILGLLLGAFITLVAIYGLEDAVDQIRSFYSSHIAVGAYTRDLFCVFLVILILGINLIISQFNVILTVKTTSGEFKKIDFLFFEKAKAEKVEQEIENLISNSSNEKTI